jgi:hypothetical protein
MTAEISGGGFFMTNRSRALALVAGSLSIDEARQRPRIEVEDWPAIFQIGGELGLIPALLARLRHEPAWNEIPRAAREHMEAITRLEENRASSLRLQAEQIVAALNLERVVPLVLRETIDLLERPESPPSGRAPRDLRILVRPEELAKTISVLGCLGYVCRRRHRDGGPVFAIYGRPGDIGPVHVHTRLVDAEGALDPEAVRRRAIEIERDDFLVCAPRLADRLLHLLLPTGDEDRGDSSKSGARLDQLYDFAVLAHRSADGADWQEIESAAVRSGLLTRLHSQVLAASRLLDLPWPLHMTPRVLARFNFGRRLAQLRYPVLTRIAPLWTSLRAAGPGDEPQPPLAWWRVWRLLRTLGRPVAAE